MKEEIIRRVIAIMGWDEAKTMGWYVTQNPNFGEASPELLVNRGRGHKVIEFLNHAEDRKRCRERIDDPNLRPMVR